MSGVPRQYTHEEKARAVAQAEAEGCSAAARALGAPVSSVRNWMTRGIGNAPPTLPTPVPPPTPVVTQTPPVAAPPTPTPVGSPVKPTARARVAKIYTPSQIAQALERVAVIGVRPASLELDISRTTLRDWERKVAKAANGDGLSPTSGPDPKTMEEQRDAAILAEWCQGTASQIPQSTAKRIPAAAPVPLSPRPNRPSRSRTECPGTRDGQADPWSCRIGSPDQKQFPMTPRAG